MAVDRTTGPLPHTPLPSRSVAERGWGVTAERPFERPPTRGGRVHRYVYAPLKRSLRKLMRWYVEPLAAQQRSFNLAVLALVDELAERAAEDAARLEHRIRALEERLATSRADSSE
jgi:hypothetical protein